MLSSTPNKKKKTIFLKMIIWHLWYCYIKDFECVQFQCKEFHCIAVADKIHLQKEKCRMGSLPAWFSLQSVFQCALKDINKHRIDEAYCLLRVRACSACASSASHSGRERERETVLFPQPPRASNHDNRMAGRHGSSSAEGRPASRSSAPK